MPVTRHLVDNPEGWRDEKELSHAIVTLSSHGLAGADDYSNCGSTVAQAAASAQRNIEKAAPVWVTVYLDASVTADSH